MAVDHASSKMLQLLRMRLRQVLRVTLVIAIGLVVATMAVAIWWLTSLNGLPDIGDPFDVAAFRAFSVADDRNAFTHFRRVAEMMTPVRGTAGAVGTSPGEPTFSWSTASPMWREWAGENLAALEFFHRAAEQPDAANAAGDQTADVNWHTLIMLASIEASRRQESGDTAGAWECYRSILRTITHFRRRGSTLQRGCARGASRILQTQLAAWAADPKTTNLQLHAALDFVLENEPDPDWDLFAVKYGYLELMAMMEQPIPVSAQREFEAEWIFRLGDMSLSPEIAGGLETARGFLLREPERSRCALRLLCANYLSHLESHQRPTRSPAVWAMFSYMDTSIPTTKRRIGVPLYPVNREARCGAGILSPEELAGWLVATRDARVRLIQAYDEWLPPVRARDRRTVADRRAHRDLAITLATEIYRRERGRPPLSEEDLVGTYLKRLPDDGSTDPSDQTTPIVE